MTHQLFDGEYPGVKCTEHLFRSIAQSAREKAGLPPQTGQVVALCTYLLERKANVEDHFDMWFDSASGRCERVFFASRLMVDAFKKHGQFISIDATCSTNRFNMPLVLLVGRDDTNKACVFGAGLVQKEDIASYVWVLTAFKSAVGKHTRRYHPRRSG
jgi:hypothetical protein